MVPKETRLSKITHPQFDGVLLREKLFEQLDKSRQKSLVWISSPGGAGKTTLVSSYLAARQLPCLWYQVDEGDADPATFFYYLGLAGKKAAPRRKKSLPLLTPEYLFGLSDFSRNYFPDLFDRLADDAVLVFDNVQEVSETAPFHQCLMEGLARLPAGMTVFLLSRAEPPAAYSRFQVNREMELLSREGLRLTLAEFKDVACLWGFETLPEQQLVELHAKMDGWAAGLQLLLRQAVDGPIEGVSNWNSTPEEIFSYFADQIFNRVDEEVQDCLLRTAFVANITLDIAEKLSGNQRAKEILKNLARRNYFTRKRRTAVAMYEYHPLFQLFLQETASQKLVATELKSLKVLSAKILIDEVRVEEAVALLADLEDWDSLSGQIQIHAQGLMEQGRFRVLQSWLEKLPTVYIEQRPWLQFWKAVSLKPADVFISRQYFEKAYRQFRQEKDPLGTYMAWTGAVETFIYLWGNFRELDPWLEEFEKIRQDHPEFPTPEIQGRITYSMFSALLWRKSNSPEMKIWSKQAESLLQKSENPTFKIIAGSNLLKYYLWCCGDLGRADAFINYILKVDQKSILPLAQLLSKVMLATYYWFKNQMDGCMQMVNEGLEFARETGIHLMDTAFHAHGAYSLLMTGDREQARVHIQKMGQRTNDQSHIDVAHYHYLCAWLQLEEGEHPAALENTRIVVERIEAAGTRQARGFGQYTHGVALCENGLFEDALKAFNKGREYGLSTGSGYFESVYQFCIALLSLRQGHAQDAPEPLRLALSIVREKNYTTIPWIGWYRSALTELLQLALEQQIEIETCHLLIKDHKLMPKARPNHLENWPWPVKIYTLGRFDVLCAGQTLQSSGKSQQRPMALLKAIIAMGGREVSETRIVDALWPDADGDAAIQSLKTTLHRLRKLLGVPEAIRYSDNCVSLDQRYCWVDIWAFGRLLPHDSKAELGEDSVSALQAGLDLYRGGFLETHTAESWVIPARERWLSRFLRSTEALGGHLARVGRHEEAVQHYLRGLDIDPHIEHFYQQLMHCYRQLGRPAAALSIYDRCRKVLVQSLGIEPSMQTEEIRKKILSAE